MRFIFPQNYNFNNKIFGFFDYCTAIFLVFCFPLVLFSIVGFNNENILYVFSYLLSFSFKNKCIFFDKLS